MVLRFLLAFSIASTSFAEDCTPFRLDLPNGSVHSVKIPTQVEGTCYAEVAAQLFDAYRFSREGANTAEPTSGLFTAIEFASHFGKNKISGGHVCETFNFLSKNGGVSENGYNQTYLLNGNVRSYIRDLLILRELYQLNMNKALSAFREQNAQNLLEKTKYNTMYRYNPVLRPLDQEDEMQNFMFARGNHILQTSAITARHIYLKYFPRRSDEELLNFFKSTLQKHGHSEYEFVEKLVFTSSFDRFRHHSPSHPVCKSEGFSKVDAHNILNRIHAAFDQGNHSLPAGIGFCYEVLEQGRRFKPSERYLMSNSFKDFSNCHMHASLIIGRRKNPVTNQCQYLIRNSEGENYCPKNISKEWSCDPIAKSIWVDADQLAKATINIETIH